MSTKTTFKRIALVAVAALGLGVLSVAPSSATVSALSVTVTNGAAGLVGAASDTTTGAAITISGLLDAGNADTITVQFIQKSIVSGSTVVPVLQFLETATSVNTVVAANRLSIASNANDSRTAYLATESVTAGQSYAITNGSATPTTATYVGAKFELFFDSITSTVRPAGTYTYTVIVKPYNRGIEGTAVSNDVNIVVTAAASASTTPNGAFTTAFIGTSANPTADAAGISALATASATAAANLAVRVRNASDTDSATDTVTISITGPGLVNNGTTSGKSISASQTGLKNYTILPDGGTGLSTITVTTAITGQTFTKTMNFYAANASTITTSIRTPALRVNTNSGAVGVTATDANGNLWTGTAYIVASSAADALIAGSTTPVACQAYTLANGIRCDVTGLAPGTAKFKVIDASTVALAKATSAEFSLVVSAAAPAAMKVEFDKTTYAPFEKAIITVYPVDASGALIPADTRFNAFAAGGITSSQAFTGTSAAIDTTTSVTSNASSSTTGAVALKQVYVVYMPAQGDVTLTWTGGTLLPVSGQVKSTTTVSVVNSSVDAATDAANEATDAANAATDAALAAADAADAATAAAQDASDAVAALSATVAKLVASLKAQITSLTNLVIKIQKKVKA